MVLKNQIILLVNDNKNDNNNNNSLSNSNSKLSNVKSMFGSSLDRFKNKK